MTTPAREDLRSALDIQHREATRLSSLPLGVRDHLGQEALARRRLEARVGAVFRAWGYNDVILPMFEYADTLELPIKAESSARLYRFFDLEGRTLVLRPDMTTSVARVVGTRLTGVEGPHRLCYAGSVFRHEESSGIGYQQEFRQLGIELVGAGTPEADAEVLACLAAALNACRLYAFSLVLGHTGYYQGLQDALHLPPAAEQELRGALHRKSEPAVTELIDRHHLAGTRGQALEMLLHLSGADTSAVLEQAGACCLNARMERALTNLRDICAGVEAHGEGDHVVLDLADIRDLQYYTGMTFEVLLPDATMVAGGGGRYDSLVGNFGAPQAAVGGALQLDRLIRASGAVQASNPLQRVAPDLLMGNTRNPQCLAFVKDLRRGGLTVIVDPLPRTETQLRELGTGQAARVTARWSGDRPHLRVLDAQEPSWIGRRLAPRRIAEYLLAQDSKRERRRDDFHG